MHRIRKSINNKYKKCHRDLFYLTDYINRKYLGDLGYYLLVDFNFKFIGIYIIPNYIRQVLKFRDKNIELKKKLEGETINHLHKKEDINKFDKSNYYINNTFYNNNIKTIFNSHINYFTFDYNINNKFNKNINMDNPNFKNDIGNDYNISNNTNNNQIKYNNFFNNVEENNNNNNIKIGDIIIDVPLNKKKINKTINSEINNRSIDKFKDYIENKYNGLGILNDKN